VRVPAASIFFHKILRSVPSIYTSNICNSSCITCYPALSTKWQSIRKIQINKKIIDRSALGNVDWAQVKMLNFLGGEPLLEEENFAILENLLKVGNSKCFIGFVTNGSISLNKWQIELFKNFEFSNLCVSVDGIGKEFEYLRYPLNWQTVEQNLKVYHSVVKWVGISYTVSNLNILYYNKTTEWFRQNKLNNNHNIVKHPNFFNIENLPVNVKKDLPLIQETNSFDSNLFSSCIKEIEIQDKLKGINIKNYLPEVAKIFDDFRRENQKLFI
jgi:organic radical activating enzyme